jgi:hypothetical protein
MNSLSYFFKAIKKVNGSFIKDRPVAADWALAKDKFLREINTLAENHCSDNGVEENVVIDSADPALKIESSEETKGTIESESSSEGDLSDLEDLEDLEENPYPQSFLYISLLVFISNYFH